MFSHRNATRIFAGAHLSAGSWRGLQIWKPVSGYVAIPKPQLTTISVRRVSTVLSDEVITPPTGRNDDTGSRVPLVLTNNLFNTGLKRILLGTFDIFSTNIETLFMSYFMSYWRERNLRDILVHSADFFPDVLAAWRASTLHFRLRYQVPIVHISSYILCDRFTCQPENSVVYYIMHCLCTVLYIAETGRRRQERFSENLRNIRNHHSPFFPVVEHFNSASHTIENIMVCEQCTLRPKWLNIRFIFIWLRSHARIELVISIVDFRKLIK